MIMEAIIYREQVEVEKNIKSLCSFLFRDKIMVYLRRCIKMDDTTLFDVKLIEKESAKMTLKEVYQILEERGYNPINQIVGYLMSGDPGYISSYKDARDKMLSVDRSELLAYLVSDYLS